VHTPHSLKPERGTRSTFGNDVPLLDVKTPKVEHFQGSHYGRQSWLSRSWRKQHRIRAANTDYNRIFVILQQHPMWNLKHSAV